MALVILPRAVVRVSGVDADTFLDALLTRDVSQAAPGAPVYAALLSPQGKLLTDLVAHRDGDGALLLDLPAARTEDTLQRLTLLRLRRKVALEARPDLAAVADLAPEALPADPRAPDGALGARRILAGAPGSDTPFKVYEERRIRAGYPDPATDAAPDEVFALEALLEEMHGVDFQKGCFIGQENVSRMKRRATTRRKFCRIVFDGPPPAPGTPVTSGSATLGEVRSGVEGAAIALLRLDRAQGNTLLAEGRPVRLDPPPFLLMPPPETA